MSTSEKNNHSPWSFDTLAVRGGLGPSELREHSEAVHLTSSFVFASAEQAARVFADEERGYLYSRFSNPPLRRLSKNLQRSRPVQAA